MKAILQSPPTSNIPKISRPQKVYIDIEKYLVFSNPSPYDLIWNDYIGNYFDSLKKQGVELIHDVLKITDDTILFSPKRKLIPEFSNANEFQEKVRECLRDEKIKLPKTIKFNEYIKKPFFPAVYKAAHFDCGEDKFLIENMHQLDRVKLFFEQIENETDMYVKYKEELIFQEFIECPTIYNTTLRVNMPPYDDVLAASIKYNFPNKVIRQKKTNLLSTEKFFLNPESPYFLNDRKIQSNSATGGNDIVLKPTRRKFSYSTFEKDLLKKHNIDPQNAEVPTVIKLTSAKIALNFERHIGILGGFDFIFDKMKGWFLLEVNGYRFCPKNFMIAYGYKEEEPTNEDICLYIDLLIKNGIKKEKLPDAEKVIYYLKEFQESKYNLLAKDTALARRIERDL